MGLFNFRKKKTDNSNKPQHIPDSVALVDDHIGQFFDNDEVLVFHEKESELIHLDVFMVSAREERPFNLLLTCGLSALPMQVPEGYEEVKYAELMMLLPPDWKLDHAGFSDENNYWPLRALKALARYPHQQHTWLGYGHSVPLGPLAQDLDVEHRFHSILLTDSVTLSDEFTYIQGTDKQAYIHLAFPIYEEELEFKRQHGMEKLLEKFDEHGISEIVDIHRKNVCGD